MNETTKTICGPQIKRETSGRLTAELYQTTEKRYAGDEYRDDNTAWSLTLWNTESGENYTASVRPALVWQNNRKPELTDLESFWLENEFIPADIETAMRNAFTKAAHEYYCDHTALTYEQLRERNYSESGWIDLLANVDWRKLWESTDDAKETGIDLADTALENEMLENEQADNKF